MDGSEVELGPHQGEVRSTFLFGMVMDILMDEVW